MDDAQRILRDAIRTHETWGERQRHSGPVPALDVIVGRDIEGMNLDAEQAARLVEEAWRVQQRRDDQIRQRRHADFIGAVGQRFAEATLDSYEATLPEQRKVVEALRSYASNIRERVAAGAGIVLFGSAGSGKTHLLCSIAKAAIEANKSVVWENGQHLFARFRAAIDGTESESEIVSELVRPDVLVLDDVLPPGGKLTDYQASVLYHIVDSRYCTLKPTLATMNVAGGDEAERGMGAQVVDRLRHGSLCMFCNWESHRKAQA